VVDRAFKVGISQGEQPTMFQSHVRNYYPPLQPATTGVYWADIWLDK
jgi:hypothetical protein